MKKRARSVLASTLITALVAMTPTAVLADTAETKANTTINVYVDGYYVPSDVPPMIDNDRVFIPMRAAAEAMGAIVEWDNNTRSVNAQKGDITAYFLIGSKTYYVNNVPIENDVAPQIVGDRTMLPIRVFAESLGADVEWDNENRNVIIRSGTSNEPESPDDENPDETYPPVIVPEYPEVNPPIVEPEYPEVDPPEESDESEKETNYNMALDKLKKGYSYEAYHGFKALGDYKNSEYYKDIAYWLNRAILLDRELIYAGISSDKWFYGYSALSENEISGLLTQSEWICPWTQSPSYRTVQFYPNGTALIVTNNGLNWADTISQGYWKMDKGGVSFGLSPNLSANWILGKRFIKLTDGLYLNVVTGYSSDVLAPGPTGELYFDKNSLIGAGYLSWAERWEASNYTLQENKIEDDLGNF